MQPSTVKNNLLNQKTLWQVIPWFCKTQSCVHRSTKRNNKNNDKTTPFRNSHTVILKTWRRVNIQNSKFNNNGNNSYEIKPKNLQNERFSCPFPEDKDKYPAEDKTGWLGLVKGQVHAIAWLGDTLELFILWENPENFLDLVEIIFGKHKDPRNEE